MSDTQVTWVEGMQFVAESAGHSIVIDGAPGFGRDTGMPPMRLLLLGAAGCSAMDVVHILRSRMRKDVTGLRIEVTSEQAEEHPKGLHTGRAEVHRQGPWAPGEERASSY